MKEVINQGIKLNRQILSSKEYIRYIETKNRLYQHPELSNALNEFRRRNYELQNRQDINPYDEVHALVREYDELLHNSIVSDFLNAERHICKMMQKMYDAIAEGLEFDYLDGH